VRPEHCKKTSSSTSEASEAGRVEVSLLVLTAVLVLYCSLLYSRVLQPMMGWCAEGAFNNLLFWSIYDSLICIYLWFVDMLSCFTPLLISSLMMYILMYEISWYVLKCLFVGMPIFETLETLQPLIGWCAQGAFNNLLTRSMYDLMICGAVLLSYKYPL